MLTRTRGGALGAVGAVVGGAGGGVVVMTGVIIVMVRLVADKMLRMPVLVMLGFMMSKSRPGGLGGCDNCTLVDLVYSVTIAPKLPIYLGCQNFAHCCCLAQSVDGDGGDRSHIQILRPDDRVW